MQLYGFQPYELMVAAQTDLKTAPAFYGGRRLNKAKAEEGRGRRAETRACMRLVFHIVMKFAP
ncbi:hypothetical protein HK405_005880 [Cladochytrium tenue]|nr:hypothetical protein HK405_005880 [Cladochytrium tenue]